MKTILFKTIFAKRWNYILLIITGILIVSSVFSLLVLVDYMIWIRTESFPEITEFIGIAEKTFIYTYIFFLLFIVLLLINYIKKRNDDYYLLEILGMQQRHMRLFIVIEYLTMVFSSIFGGFICGIGEAKIIKKGLIYFLNVDKNIHYSFNPFILTIVISFIIFFIGFAICDGLLSCMGKEFVLNIGRNKSEINYKSSKFIIIGLGFYFLTIVTLKSYWGKVGKIVPLGLALISMLILLISVYKMLLIKLNNSRKYYNNMLWMDKWYYKFFYKISMSYIMAALLFIVFFLFVIKAIDNYPFKGEVIYPYDIVWMANDSDKYFLESLEQNYNVEIEKQPCIRVTTPDFGEHIGISASQYKEWTGNEIALSDKEVFVIYQREREDRNMLGIDYGTKNPRIYIGKAQNDLWIRTVKTIPSAKFNTRFHIVGEMDNNITGIFENRSWGAFYGNVFECIIVFSDAYYDTVKENAQGANLVVMINIFDKYNKITDLIYSYAKMHSEKNFFDSKNLNIIYEKKNLILYNREQKIYNFCSSIMNAIILYIVFLFFNAILITNDTEEFQQKYQFFLLMGIPQKKTKNILWRELLGYGVSIFLSIMFYIIIFVGIDLNEKNLNLIWNVKYWEIISIILCVCVFVFVLTIWIIGQWIWRLIERKNRHE